LSDLIDLLQRQREKLGYIGPEQFSQSADEAISVSIEGDLGKENLVPSWPECVAYLDSSSRSITMKGVRITLGGLFLNDCGHHVALPLSSLRGSPPFLAVKASRDALLAVESSGLAWVRSPIGELYLGDYKDDNVGDELRLRLENWAIGAAKAPLVLMDGPLVPGVRLDVLPQRYREAYDVLIKEREPHMSRLAGVVKRLNMSWKLHRAGLDKGGRSGPDPEVMDRLCGSTDPCFSPVLREDTPLTRYMVYVRLRGNTVRVEATSRDNLRSALAMVLTHRGYRGVPTFIETADRISRRLSASVYSLAFLYGLPKLGVEYDEWSKFEDVRRELGGTDFQS
jgi:NurA domain.